MGDWRGRGRATRSRRQARQGLAAQVRYMLRGPARRGPVAQREVGHPHAYASSCYLEPAHSAIIPARTSGGKPTWQDVPLGCQGLTMKERPGLALSAKVRDPLLERDLGDRRTAPRTGAARLVVYL